MKKLRHLHYSIIIILLLIICSQSIRLFHFINLITLCMLEIYNILLHVLNRQFSTLNITKPLKISFEHSIIKYYCAIIARLVFVLRFHSLSPSFFLQLTKRETVTYCSPLTRIKIARYPYPHTRFNILQ